MPGKKPQRKRAISHTNNNNTIESVDAKKLKKIFPLEIPQRAETAGTVWVCGQGDVGQLGLGPDRNDLRRPANVAAIENAVEICAGGMHTLVLTSAGKIISFGCNDEGALGRDSSEEDSEYFPRPVELDGKAIMISAGDSHSACLLEDGTVMAWGSFRDSHGNMGLTLEGNKRVPCNLLPNIKCCSISSGTDHLVVLACNGHVYTIGCAEQGQLGRVAQRSASGDSRRGKTELLRPVRVNNPRLKQVNRIWATNYGTFVQEANSRRVLAFGLNNYKQLISKLHKEVISCPVVVDVENVKTIAGGQHHTIVLRNDGTVHAVGRHEYGRLGVGKVASDVEILTPLEAFKNVEISDVNCGESTSFAITSKGELYAWGFGSNNQLGTGTDDDIIEPQLVEFKNAAAKKPVLRVASGGQHSVFIVKTD